jgi:hypothetical protein
MIAKTLPAPLATGTALLALALLLPGCKKEPAVVAKDADAGEVAAKVASAGVKFQPGAWSTQVKAIDIDMPGMPPEMVASMKDSLGRARAERSCLTKEKAARPDGDFFGQADKTCRYKTFTMADGKIDGVLNCGHGGANQTITLKGTYGGDHFTMDMDMTGSGPGGKQMRMHVATQSNRVGECTPQEKAQADADEKAASI